MTAERLRELLNYDPASGVFTRLASYTRKDLVGTVAGWVHHTGYYYIRVGGGTYSAGRLAWLYAKGVWPSYEIDHINGERADNRFSNLREATRAQNNQNACARKNRGLWLAKGVSIHKRHKCFQVQIQANGRARTIHCPRSWTLGEAADLYAKLARELHGEFARVE